MTDYINNGQTIILVSGLVLLVLFVLVGYLRSRARRVIGLDVGNAQIKAVELSGGRKPTLRNFAVLPTPPGSIKDGQVLDADLLASTIRDMLRSSGFVGRRVSTALTGQNLLLRTVELPAMPKKEIPEAVKWQFDQYFQLSSEEAVSDYQIVSGASGGPLSVMLVAMQKGPVVSIVNTIKQAGFIPLRVDIEPLTVLRAVSFGCDQKMMQGLNAVFDFGAGTTNVSIFKDGILRVARTIHFGGKRFTHALMEAYNWDYEQAEAEKKKHGLAVDSPIADVMIPLRDELFLELSRTVNFYLADNREVALTHVFMLGGGSLLSQLGRQLKSYLSEYINLLGEDFTVAHCGPLGHLNVKLPKGKTLLEDVNVATEEDGAEELTGLGLVLGVAVGMALGEVSRNEG